MGMIFLFYMIFGIFLALRANQWLLVLSFNNIIDGSP
jgi:hypothetical protein